MPLNEKLLLSEQIAEMIEKDILLGEYQVDDQVMSTTLISKSFQINPATAVRGINLLVNEGILYKKRGIGMFITEDARAIILRKRRKLFHDKYIVNMLEEAKILELSKKDVIEMIEQVGEE
jgi:GntR family transcriptional regulator